MRIEQPGANTFLDLIDTPSSYSGESGKGVNVKSAEDGVEFTTGGGGLQIETPTGTVDGSNVTFTVVNTPQFIVVDGMVRFSGLGYTESGGTITVDALAPPTEYIRSFY